MIRVKGIHWVIVLGIGLMSCHITKFQAKDSRDNVPKMLSELESRVFNVYRLDLKAGSEQNKQIHKWFMGGSALEDAKRIEHIRYQYILRNLVSIDAEVPKGDLVASWEASPDGLTYLMSLKDRVMLADGSWMNSNEVVRILESYAGKIKGYSKCVIVDNKNFKIVLQERNSKFFENLASVDFVTRSKIRKVSYRLESCKAPPLLIEQKTATLKNYFDSPCKTFYRIEPNSFRFRKMLEAPSDYRKGNVETIDMIVNFLIKRKFIISTEKDNIGRTIPHDLIDNKDQGTDQDGKNLLLLQGVKCGRTFEGMPVVNSKVSVDFHPVTSEILGFKHYFWTPVNERSGHPIPPNDVRNPKQMLKELSQRTEKYSRGDSVRTNDVAFAWFQTDKSLIPIVAFGLVVDRPEGFEFYAEYIALCSKHDPMLVKNSIIGKPNGRPIDY